MKDQIIPDKDLRELVIAALHAVQQEDVRVGVLNGIVHLGGAAQGEAEWRLAEWIAADVPGVRGVVNRIAAPGAPSPSRIVNINLSEAKNEEQS